MNRLRSVLSHIRRAPSVLECELLESRSVGAKKIAHYRFFYDVDGVRVEGFLLLPPAARRLPVLFFCRGGNRSFSVIDDDVRRGQLATLASWGYCVVASQYRRGRRGAGRDEFGGRDVDDVESLKPLVDALPFTDEKRVGVVAFSRGAVMCFRLATKVDWIKTAIVIGGLTDLARQARLRPEMRVVFESHFGGGTAQMRARSAVHFAAKISRTTSFLLMHGANDWRVSPLDAIDLSERFLELGVRHKLIVFPGAGHTLSECDNDRDLEMRRWLRAEL